MAETCFQAVGNWTDQIFDAELTKAVIVQPRNVPRFSMGELTFHLWLVFHPSVLQVAFELKMASIFLGAGKANAS